MNNLIGEIYNQITNFTSINNLNPNIVFVDYVTFYDLKEQAKILENSETYAPKTIFGLDIKIVESNHPYIAVGYVEECSKL